MAGGYTGQWWGNKLRSGIVQFIHQESHLAGRGEGRGEGGGLTTYVAQIAAISHGATTVIIFSSISSTLPVREPWLTYRCCTYIPMHTIY